MYVEELKDYIIEVDKVDVNIIKQNIEDKGLEGYLNKQLEYLDCSRIINNRRMMQTIGCPYCREISCYLYALDNCVNFMTCDEPIKFDKAYWVNKLIALHIKNLKYEESNPPIWYNKKNKPNWENPSKNKLPRRRKSTVAAKADKPIELTDKERLQRLNANFGKLNFKIKLPSK
jgi:hypothetical protein